jgi:hypothetical protein
VFYIKFNPKLIITLSTLRIIKLIKRSANVLNRELYLFCIIYTHSHPQIPELSLIVKALSLLCRVVALASPFALTRLLAATDDCFDIIFFTRFLTNSGANVDAVEALQMSLIGPLLLGMGRSYGTEILITKINYSFILHISM